MKKLNLVESFARFRRYKKMSKTDFCKFLGIQPGAYTYENPARNTSPLSSRLFDIAQNYEVSTDYLLGLTDDPRPVDEILKAQEMAGIEKLTTPNTSVENQLAELKSFIVKQQNEIAELKNRVAVLELKS